MIDVVVSKQKSEVHLGCLLSVVGLLRRPYVSQSLQRGPVRGGAHVPRLNFTATYVAISEHSRVACRNFINKCFTSFAPLTIHIRWNDANGTYGLYL